MAEIKVSKGNIYAITSAPQGINASKGNIYTVLMDIAASINISKANVYAVVSESEIIDDGISAGGPVFGGTVTETILVERTEAASSGGPVFSGIDENLPENDQVDGLASGGIVFSGDVRERYSLGVGSGSVAVKGGTYRIGGIIYTLANTMYYEGLGEIAALVDCGVAPTSSFRYDVLSIDMNGNITVTHGTEAATPVMPATPDGEVKLDHVFRYAGQESIIQADIGRLYTTPSPTRIEVTIADDDLSWSQLSTAITVKVYNQYGQLYSQYLGTWIVMTATFLYGNGTIAPTSRSGLSTFSFTYTRDRELTDISPSIQFTSSFGAIAVAMITLRDESGARMY